MINIQGTNLYIGSRADLPQTNSQDWAFVHATQTIHYALMGWDRKQNKPNKKHPNYIIWEQGNTLSLNWVDGPAHLYEWSGPAMFTKVLDFIDKWIGQRKVLINCDQGHSRAPTLGLLYLSKRAKSISNESFDSARNDFVKLYPNYLPKGIGGFVNNKWPVIV